MFSAFSTATPVLFQRFTNAQNVLFGANTRTVTTETLMKLLSCGCRFVPSCLEHGSERQFINIIHFVL